VPGREKNQRPAAFAPKWKTSLTGAANPSKSKNEKSIVEKICQQLTQRTRSLTKTRAAVKQLNWHRKTENKKLRSLRAAVSHDQGENDDEELRNEKSQSKIAQHEHSD
jgi:hypothetical protein